MLESIELPGSKRITTRLGFGCSGLMGGLSEKESLYLLETAFEAGIRHFDVAPSYGHGMAERCLGKFLRDKAERITVTTKYGISPARHAGIFDVARKVVRPLARRNPNIRRQAAQTAASFKKKASFSKSEAQRSLQQSLRELGLSQIDLWLLHEVTVDDLHDPGLLEFLCQKQEEGVIGTYGLGTERRNLATLWNDCREYCPVLQFEWSVIDGEASFPGAFCIRHRAISGALDTIQRTFRADPSLFRRWSNEVDVDLANSQILAELLLRASLMADIQGMVLFSSRIPAHILANVEVAKNPAWTNRTMRFLELIKNQYRSE